MMVIGRDGLGARSMPGGCPQPRRAGTAILAALWAAHGVRGCLALILLSGALATGACTLPEDGATPLHTAAGWNSNPSVILALIEGGADLPIARCGRLGRVITVFGKLALIEGGADPDARNEFGATPLHTAAGNNTNLSVIKVLIECGADPGARDYDGFTPFDYAKENEALKGTETYWLLYEALFE